MQKYFLSFLLGGLLVAGVALADHGEETGVDAVDPEEMVTSADLGVEDAGILPTSRLYFFKEWGRGIRSFFTFGSVKKAELELRFTNEKAAEAKEVQEIQPNNEQAITKALENYQKSQERLKVRLESLKETSQNPNVDRLLDQVTEKAVKHAKLMEEIALKTKDIASLQKLVLTVREKIEESTASGAAKDDPAKFASRLEKSLVDSKGGELKHLRSVAFIDGIYGKTAEGVKKSLEGLREEFSEKLQENLKIVLGKKTSEDFSHALEKVPGDAARRSVILEEIRVKASDKTASALDKAQEVLEEKISNMEDRMEKAAEQIRRASDVVQKAERVMQETAAPQQAPVSLRTEAEKHLQSAKAAFENAEYGEAFGQARAAEVTARNAVNASERREETSDAVRVIERAKERVLLPSPPLPKVKVPREGIEAPPPGLEKKPTTPPVLCTQEYKPVCGVDGKTYSNRCVAEKQNRTEVVYEGECKQTTERYFKFAMLDNQNEFIVVKMTDPATVKKALEDLQGKRMLVVGGTLKTGNEGYNSRWSWHMDSESVKLGEIWMEVCDARPTWVESHLEEWIGKTYCPWGAKITQEVYPSLEREIPPLLPGPILPVLPTPPGPPGPPTGSPTIPLFTPTQ